MLVNTEYDIIRKLDFFYQIEYVAEIKNGFILNLLIMICMKLSMLYADFFSSASLVLLLLPVSLPRSVPAGGTPL